VTEHDTSVEWTGGRPPAGFTVSDTGYLQRDEEDWETVRRAAAAVETRELTEYRAAKVTGVSRHAIRTAQNECRVEEADPLRIDDADDEQPDASAVAHVTTGGVDPRNAGEGR